MEHRTRASSASVEERYKVLLDVGRILTATLQPEELYREIFAQTQRVLDLSGFSIVLYDDASDLATVVFHAHGDQSSEVGTRFRGSEIAAIRSRSPQISWPPHVTVPCLPSPSHTSCSLVAPLIADGHVLGLLCACSATADGYGAEDLELFAAVADHAAVALVNARFVEEREQRRRESDRLEEIGRLLSASLDLPKVLERVVDIARELTDADSAAVWLVHDDNTVEIAMTAGEFAPPRGLVLPFPESLRPAADARTPLVFKDVRNDSIIPAYIRSIARTISGMAVALVVENKLVGALSVGHKQERRYSSDEVHLLERLSFQAAIAVANARLHEQILALSLTDPLTGLPNRRNFELFLEKEFAAAKRGRRLTVMLFDLDNFKTYNDRAGHQAGDNALRAFANVLKEQTRAMNLAARYGGDEFISILADTDRRGGVTHASRIARAVATDPLLGQSGIRASAGIASYTPRMQEPADLIRAADRDLYARKNNRGQELHIASDLLGG